MRQQYWMVILGIVLVSGCASTSPTGGETSGSTPAGATNSDAKVVKSIDGTYTGEIVGTVAPDSKFAKLKIGMTMAEVHELIKAPDDMIRHETGKRWIPFYFGNDAQRIQTYYAGEGCLTYTGGNVFGGGGNQLIRITVHKTKQCMD